MPFTHDEIEDAFARYRAAAEEAGRTGDWRPWVERFTPDVRYVEHMYGEFRGREAVLAWITPVMTVWPFTHMQLFPWDWYTVDAEQGWVVGQVENRFVDPGDGNVYEAANWTRLLHAGDALFSEEEDVYNPAEFEPVVAGWLAAWKAITLMANPESATPGTMRPRRSAPRSPARARARAPRTRR